MIIRLRPITPPTKHPVKPPIRMKHIHLVVYPDIDLSLIIYEDTPQPITVWQQALLIRFQLHVMVFREKILHREVFPLRQRDKDLFRILHHRRLLPLASHQEK